MGGIGQWHSLRFLLIPVLLSGINSLPIPNPQPFLLVNRGEINIHDSVQRVGHSHYKSHGGRIRYWNVGSGDTLGSRQGKALPVEADAEPRGFPNGVSMSADSSPHFSQDSVILRRDSGFQPSQFQFTAQNLQNPPDYQQQKPIIQGYQQQQQVLTSTTGYVHTQTRDQVTYQNPQNRAPSNTYGDQSGLHLQQQQQQFQGYPRNPLKKFIGGIKGKVSKAIKSVKSAFKSIIFKKKRPPVQKEGIGYNRRNNLFGMDFWNLDSPLGRLYRWFNSNPLIQPPKI